MKESESISKTFLDKETVSEEEILYPEINLSELEPEIELISDPNIKKFVRYLLKHAPAFWKAPASQIEGIHPPDEEFPGGLILHTKRTVRTAVLLSTILESDSQNDFDCLIAAAILHDISKYMSDEENSEFLFDPMHPYTVDRYVDWSRQECMTSSHSDLDNTIDIDANLIGVILRLVRCSHGVWSPIPETVPVTEMEKALHTADLIAANLHGIIDGLDIKKERWL